MRTLVLIILTAGATLAATMWATDRSPADALLPYVDAPPEVFPDPAPQTPDPGLRTSTAATEPTGDLPPEEEPILPTATEPGRIDYVALNRQLIEMAEALERFNAKLADHTTGVKEGSQ